MQNEREASRMAEALRALARALLAHTDGERRLLTATNNSARAHKRRRRQERAASPPSSRFNSPPSPPSLVEYARVSQFASCGEQIRVESRTTATTTTTKRRREASARRSLARSLVRRVACELVARGSQMVSWPLDGAFAVRFVCERHLNGERVCKRVSRSAAAAARARVDGSDGATIANSERRRAFAERGARVRARAKTAREQMGGGDGGSGVDDKHGSALARRLYFLSSR